MPEWGSLPEESPQTLKGTSETAVESIESEVSIEATMFADPGRPEGLLTAPPAPRGVDVPRVTFGCVRAQPRDAPGLA